MNKKFLSAILFGALMVTSTGTFVSCKDYDDDIENLQEQINKLATKDDLSSQIATLQSALNNAASNATDAIAKATAAEAAAKAAGDEAAAAKAAAEKTAAEAEAKAIEAAKATVESTKAELEDLVAAGMAENKTELEKMAAKVDEATKQVEEIVGSISDMVTSVELVYSNAKQTSTWWYANHPWWEEYDADKNYKDSEIVYEELKDADGNVIGYKYYYVNDRDTQGYRGETLYTTTIVEKDNKFGPSETAYIEFTKGTQIQRGGEFTVRVSPANAELLPEMITFVNSKGEALDMMDVTKVSRYNGLLTRAAENSGLWTVEYALKEYDEKAFAAAQATDNGRILYAIQVNNTLTTASTRYATSSYDLTLGRDSWSGLNRLYFYVDDTHVDKINNRVYDDYSNSYADRYNSTYRKDAYKEMEWRNSAAVAPIVNKDGHNVFVANVEDYLEEGTYYWVDERGDKNVYPAVQGVPMTISLTKWYSCYDYEDP